ncbi:MAG: lysophospholipid acyltransferase family protein [Chloroflexi bacterium]|nr:lysophospholipid acyltransferase family protein [Chloroflexota bacterium]MCY3582767.1 lysophospholipid acyltransferase family protein [Chloroflexota bacterium]MCY3715474.1 lysophospholipid acyltransferase family protein [Chloroflexota bacterium]MDE2650294.1 lysophospholipid acyltransferase family protein [Chloroflexota bacterium]MXV93773.1 1-acyl-sn-glycerol-3-phosphate acyltransferase [Chloroflexota bacterium]
MTAELSIEETIARQPHYDKRRRILHPLLRAALPSFCRLEVAGVHNVPRQGPTCLMINHVSYLDPIVVTAAIPFRHTISLSKIENFRLPVVGWLLRQWGHYPISRGQYDRKALMQTIALLQAGQLMLMAPEGTRHVGGLQPAKEGLAFVASKADAVIVPAAICGAEDWRKRLKRARRAYAKVVFGAPFRFRRSDRKRIPRPELTQMITEAMYQLALAIPVEYAYLRGYYSDIDNASSDLLEFV